jgi:hypothetical protein
MTLHAVDQLGMDETIVQDAELERLLEERMRRRVVASETRLAYTEADQAAKGGIAKLELPAGRAVRVGRFRITRTHVPPRSVSFETEATSRVNIGLIEDEHA